MPRVTKSSVSEELERIRLAHRGRLKPIHVVDAARQKSSPLHVCFEWNDGKAAEAHRLNQARELIRMSMKVVHDTEGSEVKVARYHSLRADRAEKTGYREITEILATPTLRRTMLKESLEDLQAWETRHRRLEELAPIRTAAAKVRKAVLT